MDQLNSPIMVDIDRQINQLNMDARARTNDDVRDMMRGITPKEFIEICEATNVDSDIGEDNDAVTCVDFWLPGQEYTYRCTWVKDDPNEWPGAEIGDEPTFSFSEVTRRTDAEQESYNWEAEANTIMRDLLDTDRYDLGTAIGLVATLQRLGYTEATHDGTPTYGVTPADRTYHAHTPDEASPNGDYHYLIGFAIDDQRVDVTYVGNPDDWDGEWAERYLSKDPDDQHAVCEYICNDVIAPNHFLHGAFDGAPIETVGDLREVIGFLQSSLAKLGWYG